MTIERGDYQSYFGLFKFNFAEDPKRVWTGRTDKIRIEVSSQDGKSGNWMGVSSEIETILPLLLRKPSSQIIRRI